MLRASLAATVLVAISPIAAFALDESNPEIRELNPLEAFSHLPGEWRITPYFPGPNGLTPGQPGRSTIESVFDGVAFQGTNEIPFPGGVLRMRNLLTYDRNHNEFRFAAVDEGTGVLDIYEGVMEDGSLEVDNLDAGLYFVTQGGARLQFKLHWYDLTPDEYRFDVYWTADEGANWSLYAGHVYERIDQD